jgi:hypothetical protein
MRSHERKSNMLTDIYRIRTKNSIYEIHVSSNGGSRCRKESGPWNIVKADTPEYLEKLFIGPSFDVPGVVLTSRVLDYVHLVPSGKPARVLEDHHETIPGFFEQLTNHVVNQVKGQVVVVGENDEESYA